MVYLEWLFWFLFISIFYSYLVYPLILFLITSLIKKNKLKPFESLRFPTITLFVTAYNEEDYVVSKVENSLKLNYPKEKLRFIWVTDGSTDKTNDLLAKYPEVTVLYEPLRMGKVHAMNRGMQFVDSEIVVFTDGNTLLNNEALIEMVNCFQNLKVACVSGEKRILLSDKENAAGFGEGFYWKYESFIKKLDAKIGSVIGAPGELFAIRKALYKPVETDTILDDFIISMRLALLGYKIDYAPNAYAIERASANVKEEMKRKVRIAAGSFQVLFRLKDLLNPMKRPILWFQYLSHKVFRWVITPLSLPLLLLVNILIVTKSGILLYDISLSLQILFFGLVLLGYFLKEKSIKTPIWFVPYYFFIANWAMWLGFFRYLKGKQPAAWERSKRA